MSGVMREFYSLLHLVILSSYNLTKTYYKTDDPFTAPKPALKITPIPQQHMYTLAISPIRQETAY